VSHTKQTTLNTGSQTTHTLTAHRLSRTAQRRMDDMTKMAMEALVRELMKKNEVAEDRIKELEEELKKKDEELKKKDEELVARSMQTPATPGVAVSERSVRRQLPLQPTLTEEEKLSSIEKMRTVYDNPERGERYIKKVMENPTFTVLYREEGHIRAKSYLGKRDKPKCSLYPEVFRKEGGCGTAYMRWEEGPASDPTVYYMAGFSTERHGFNIDNPYDCVMYQVKKGEVTDLKKHKRIGKKDVKYKRLNSIGISLYEAVGFS